MWRAASSDERGDFGGRGAAALQPFFPSMWFCWRHTLYVCGRGTGHESRDNAACTQREIVGEDTAAGEAGRRAHVEQDSAAAHTVP